MAQPLRPEDVAEAKTKQCPETVIEAFNKLIALNYSGGSATVKQEDVIAEILATTDTTRELIFSRGYLNVEEIFRQAGWKVRYIRPDYTENFPAWFDFKK
jgi:hypothetical protein